MSSNIAMSLRTKKYFDELSSKTNILYDIATRAKLNAKEPEVETHPASDIAARVEGLVGPKGIANAIRRIKEEKMSREEIAFKISEEIVLGRFGAFEEEKGADIAIRAALSLLTEGLTAAPQEGISKVKIKKNPDGSRYLAIYFAGPIRAAGGTETAIAVLIGDYIRQRLHLNRYLPKAEEVERVVEEIALYSRVGHVQIPVPPEDIKFAAERLPVEVTGEPTEQVEVSGHRDLERVETNRVRGGACLVINDGIIGRAHKITNLIEKVGLTGWDWLKELAEKRKGAKVNGNEKEGEETTEIKPVEKYLEDVIVGRPIFCHPSKIGGFRLRYGRSRNTGLSAVGLNPATMIILEDFLAPGTHIVTERPGKGAIVMPVDTIEGPIVKLNDGTVVEIKDEKEAIILVNSVEEILFLGDILVGFGEFLENNHPLMPSSFTKEIWCSELQKTITKLFQNDIENAVQEIEIEKEKLIQFIKDPLKTNPDPVESLKISVKLKIPLHPSYTYFWNNLTEKDVFMLRQWIIENKKQFSKDFITKIEGPFSQKIKNILENLMIPHKNENSTIILEEHAPTLSATLGISKNIDTKIDLIDQTQNSSLSIVNRLASFPIKDKFSGIYIGARMGRPEKAKKRTMSPPVHGLFPVGMAGGKTRNIIDASKKRKIWVEIVRKECECGHTTYKINCPKCGKKPRIRNTCINCGTVSDATICPKCGGESRPYSKQETNLEEELENLRKKIGGLPSLIKGVQGLLSETKTPEPLIKGILRAKHDIYVFKDGTVRFDATDAPLTHFKPKEIKISIDKLKELDYTHDIHGNPLKNDEQILELKVQDTVISEEGATYLLKTANFIDTLLQKYYNMPPFYNTKKIEELIGHLVIGLAPHTSAGIIGRIIGFTKAKVTFAHPYWHAAKRRNCDGDEDSIILALDAFLNFSKSYLPSSRGGLMDAPLVVTITLNPEEVDDESHKVDAGKKYPPEFYKLCKKMINPKKAAKIIDILEHRLGTVAQFEGIYYTHETSNIASGPQSSAYKKLKSMSEKLQAQLRIAKKVKAVDLEDVAERIINHHLLPDLLGCMRAFGTQSFRCVNCNQKYRRIPLKGKCLKCGGKLLLTVSRKTVMKYFNLAKELVKKYNLQPYLQQRLELFEDAANTLFETENKNQRSLSDFSNLNENKKEE